MPEITRGWPPKRRKEQAERICKQRPWKESTGPKSAAGKERSRMNAMKHGMRSAPYQATRRRLGQLLRLQSRFIKDINRIPRGKSRLRLSFLFDVVNNVLNNTDKRGLHDSHRKITYAGSGSLFLDHHRQRCY